MHPNDVAAAFRHRVYARRDACPTSQDGIRERSDGTAFSASYRANRLIDRVWTDHASTRMANALVVAVDGKGSASVNDLAWPPDRDLMIAARHHPFMP
jgi:hypothetical protein